MIRVVLHGAGRMAQGVLAELQAHPQFELLAVVSRSEPVELLAASDLDIRWFSSLDNFTAGTNNSTTNSSTTNSSTTNSSTTNNITTNSSTTNSSTNNDVDGDVDLLIDFTLAGGPATAASWCQQNGVAMLSGTTGLSEDDQRALKSAALAVPVLWASNMSKGIALISALARQAAISLGDVADITISDIHHQHKQDAPSGTALTLAEAVMDGHQEGEVAFISIRKGEVIGEHTISFELPGEIVEISHKARDRSVFAKGALSAGVWLSEQKPGYYSTSDWLKIG